MNRITNFLAVFALVFSFSLTASAQEERAEMPDVELKTMDGQTVKLKDYIKEGELTYVTFWATWCSPCKKELDDMIDLHEEWKTKYNMNIVAVSVDDQRTTSKVKGTVDAKGWEYQVLCDPNQLCYQKLNFQSVPQSFLIDKNGKIAQSHTGYKDGDLYELEKHLEELSKE